MKRLLGPSINIVVSLIFFNKIDEIIKIQSSVKSIGKCKKNPYIISQDHIFFQKIIVKSFLDRFLQMLHQNIRNCLYFDWLFTHYIVMSDFLFVHNLNTTNKI